MIILTGMDNSGKTTLAQKLSKELNLPIVKSIGPQATTDEKHLWLMDQLTREAHFPDCIIYDRFLPFEEMVYGKILRGNPIYNLDDDYVKALKEMEPTIIYTRPPSTNIFNFGTREQMDGVVETSQKLLIAWDDLMWHLMADDWNVQVYDYTAKENNI